MKVVFIRDTFLKAGSLVAQVVNPRPNLPVLGNFLLTTNAGALEITATNLDTTIVHKIPVQVLRKGAVTVPARTLLDFCQALESKQVELADEKETLLVTAAGVKAKLATIDPSEFPKISEVDGGEPVTLKKRVFLEGVSQVSLSAAPEEGRPILTGVSINSEKNKLVLVATDGYRLSKKESRTEGSISAVIPARALREAAKAIAEQEDDSVALSVDMEKNQAILRTRNLMMITRLLEGDFPNYEQIMPDSFTCEALIDTKELVDGVKLAALFAKDVGNVVRVAIEDRELDISASTVQVGEAQTKLRLKKISGNIKVAFNSRFLLEALATIKEKETALRFSGPTSAALLNGHGNQSLVHVVMPVRPQG